MSLYTKYRPRDWDSVIGQDAISNILRSSLMQDRVGHAYILTGSRGTGKTTTARILAKWVNCLDLQNGNPCHQCTHCKAFDEGNMLDCIEIDGASNNGVENVRDLIEKARFEPNQWKYKIYIIDEVHMLSTGAFNALLKTLEEPPDHVKFILATTEIEKVPETIRSRSLRFDFKKISEPDIVKRLEFVCKEEGIKAEKEWLEIIAHAARGALRDALTLTEQNTVNNEIQTGHVRSTLSLIEDSLIDEVIQVIINCDRNAMITILDTLRSQHAEVRGLFDQILYTIRDLMFASFQWKNTKNSLSFAEYSEIFAIFESAYAKIRTIPDGWLLIEITLLRAVARGDIKAITPQKPTEAPKEIIKNTIPTPEKKIETITPLPKIETPRNETTVEKIAESLPAITEKKIETPASNSTFSYIRLLEEIKKVKSTLVLDLKTARFEHTGMVLTLIFTKEWHYNRTNNPSMKNIISECLEWLYTGNWIIECRLDGMSWANIADDVF